MYLHCVRRFQTAGRSYQQVSPIQVRLRSVCFSPLLFSVGKVLEDREAIIQQKNQLDKTSQQLKHHHFKKETENTKVKDWYDSDRRIGSKMAKDLRHCKFRLKELHSCVFNLERKVNGLKAKLSASTSMMSKLLCRGKVSWRDAFRIRASIRQLHYRLFQCRCRATNIIRLFVVLHTLSMFFFHVCAVAVPFKGSERTPICGLSSVWPRPPLVQRRWPVPHFVCVKHGMAHRRMVPDSKPMRATGKKETGKLVGGVIGVALPRNKTAETEPQLTHEAKVRLMANGEGL